MSTTAGNAERLQRTAGTWRMEFEQLVYNAPAILRPRRFAVLGEHAILQQLREFTGHEPLAKDAERLFARGALPDGTYIAKNGRWLPELRPDAVVAEPEPEAPSPPPGQLPAELVEEMSERVAALEGTVKSLQKMLETAMRGISELSQRTVAVPVAAAAAGVPAAPVPSPVAAASQQPVAAAAMGVAATNPAIDPIAAAAAAIMARPAVDPNAKPISLPTPAALGDIVKSLAGPSALLSPSDKNDWAALAGRTSVYAAPILTNEGSDVGAMLMDLEAALRLAGALLMESDELVNSLVDENMMSDEMLDAASEVCNTFMSSFNKVPGNPHLRVGKLELQDAERMSWIASSRKYDDYRYGHGGRVAMVVR